jgi:hypothetical protein
MISRIAARIGSAWCRCFHRGFMYAGGSHRQCRTCLRRVRVPHSEAKRNG